MKKFSILLAAAFVAMSCGGSKPGPDEIWYTTTDGMALQLSGVGDAETFGTKILYNTYEDGKGVIIFDESVTLVGAEAFDGCYNLESVTLPDGITSIGESAFSNCAYLTSVNIPNGVTSIGAGAFYDCESLTDVHISDLSAWCKIMFDGGHSNPLHYGAALYLNGELFTDLTVPSDITEINSYAFYGCSSLASVNIPNRVTSVGACAFYGCRGELTVDNNALFENDYTARDCPSESYYTWLSGARFTKVTIGENVKRIGENTFYGFSTSIGTGAFFKCSALTSINIPESVTSIGRGAFQNCKSLTKVTLPNGLTSIEQGLFYECTALTDVTVPESVTSIEKYAFSKCENLANVTIPNGVTAIGDEAFYRCKSLTSITVPNSVTSIGDGAFYDCSGELIIDNQALVEQDYSSSDYPAISYYYSRSNWLLGNDFTKLTIGENITRIGNYTFAGCNALAEVNIPASVTSIGEGAFYGCKSLTEATIPAGVTSIEAETFAGCSALTSVTIPDGVTSIGYKAFDDCTGLTSITIPASVTSIGEWAFSGCYGLTDVTLSEGLNSIGSGAFSACNALASITIPASVTSIGGSMFFLCKQLNEVYCKAATPPTLESPIFNDTPGTTLYVPKSSVDAYKSARNWSVYKRGWYDHEVNIVGHDF